MKSSWSHRHEAGPQQRRRGRGTQGAGVCLSKNALLWHEAAGSRFIAVNGRFCAFRLLIGTSKLCSVVWCAPTSDATTIACQNNLNLLAELTEKCGPEEMLFIVTDANAATGPSSDQDRVVGPFSSPHENAPGTHLRTLLANNARSLRTRHLLSAAHQWHVDPPASQQPLPMRPHVPAVER